MKFSTAAISIFAATTAMALPLGHEHNIHKRDVVTEVVHQTLTYYQKQVVYVDQNGNPFSTGIQIVSTAVSQAQAETVSSTEAAPTSTSVATSAVSTSEYVAPTSTFAPESSAPSSTQQTSSSAPESTSSPAPETTTSSEVVQVTSSSEAAETTTSVYVPTSTSEAAETTTSVYVPTTTSVYVPTTTSVYVPTTTSEPASTTLAVDTTSVVEDDAAAVTSSAAAATSSAAAATSSAAASSSSSSSSSSGSGSNAGDGTYYDTGLGACGITSTDSDYIVAISHVRFDAVNTGNPNNNPLCGKKITAYRGSKSVEVTVVDRCPGCEVNSLDFSPAAFEQLGDESEGRIHITWDFN